MQYELLEGSFFHSALAEKNIFQTFEEFLSWFGKKKKEGHFLVKEIPFSEFDQWSFSENKECLKHSSGRFFRIEGLNVQTNFGNITTWDQPIINQPEIGILGILTKVFNGTRYFLMQAKMEPGNINVLQLSPTVQATKSNFTRVHKGKLPTYLEYFVEPGKSRVLIDQLQTEQGGRFYKKRNRNIVVEVTEDIEVLDDFKWLTLFEIKKLLRIDNFVNMDARSVLSTIPLIEDAYINLLQNISISDIVQKYNLPDYAGDILYSICNKQETVKTLDEIISWYTDQIVRYELTTTVIPLTKMQGWEITSTEIKRDERFFSVIGVKVEAGTREVSRWTQPLIKDTNIGLLGLLVKKINGVLHFLVQAKVEPGNIDVIEISPTVSCSNYAYIMNQVQRPLFFDYFLGNKKVKVLYDTLQSEEGGRFYHLQNRNMIVEIDENEQINLPPNFTWMSLSQMMNFMRFSMFNIEARSLVSSINFI